MALLVPPQKISGTIVAKRPLTHDVWEIDIDTAQPNFLVYPGMFMMFFLAPAPNRAYSIAWRQGSVLRFIIKRLENGGGGSKAICDMPVGASLPIQGPFGHFVPQNVDKKRLFIGTGTGFAPLYYQIRFLLEQGFSEPLHFLFGVRTQQDVFYRDELQILAQKCPHFSYQLCTSRDAWEGCYSGRVTDAIAQFPTDTFSEFFLCGSPEMVKDMRALLEARGHTKESILFEQY